MPDSHRSPLADLPHRVRDEWQALPGRWRAWRADFDEDPTLIWRTPVVRIIGIVILGIGLLLLGQWLITGLSPTSGGAFAEATPTATLYVACTNTQCRHHFTITTPMDFDEWPVTCPECGEKTAYRASRCPDCGQWFAVVPGAAKACPHCAAREAAREADTVVPDAGPASSHDDEDPW
jgi:predicted RNA-binding Zn-ribbon protein involved in translation (DUF1610 family)